jgi:hypothetical protein
MAHLAHFLLKFPGPISPSNLSCCRSIYTTARHAEAEPHSRRRHMQSYACNAACRQAQIRLHDLQSSAGHGLQAHSEGWGSSSAFSNPAVRLWELNSPSLPLPLTPISRPFFSVDAVLMPSACLPPKRGGGLPLSTLVWVNKRFLPPFSWLFSVASTVGNIFTPILIFWLTELNCLLKKLYYI